MFVAQRDFVVQHPAIRTISSPDACFVYERLPTSQGRAPSLHNAFDVVGMNCGCPFPALNVLA
jgi:hypothetical protein